MRSYEDAGKKAPGQRIPWVNPVPSGALTRYFAQCASRGLEHGPPGLSQGHTEALTRRVCARACV